MLKPEDIIVLSPYEKHLRNALSDFMCNPGRTAIKAMDNIYRRATGYPLTTDTSCGRCILNTMKRVAELYFAEKSKTTKTTKHETRKNQTIKTRSK